MPSSLLTIGVLYLFAIGAGRMCAAVGIPRVTGYLLVGLAAGPSLGGILGIPLLFTPAQLSSLAPLHDLILGLIIFTIGGSFRLKALRKIGPRLFRVSLLEIVFSAICVGIGTWLVGVSVLEAAFLAVMAITTAPAATQMVMREYRSEGPLTDIILPLIGINNLVAIVGFLLLQHFGLSGGTSVLQILIQILGPLGLGICLGLSIALMDQRLTRQVERQMLVLGSIALAGGVSSFFGLSAMLTVLFAGITAVNAASRGERILADLTPIDYPFYVLFFIMAGAKLHLEALGHMGWVGLVYVVARVIGKHGGCRIGTMTAGMTPTIKSWLGPAMLAQAGLAIGLANVLAAEWPEQGMALQTVILAAVVVFELVGPLLTRTALVQAGEVTVLNLLGQRSPVSYWEGLRQVCNRALMNLGYSPIIGRELPENIQVRHIMRRNVDTISHKAHFDEVVKTLSHSRYGRMPVVNDNNELIGVIKYTDIADTIFDPSLNDLVVAAEIASDKFPRLSPEDTLKTAMLALKDHPKEAYLLVVAANDPCKLVGIVSHNDLLAAHMHRSSSP